jgi:hypothetical protein
MEARGDTPWQVWKRAADKRLTRVSRAHGGSA